MTQSVDTVVVWCFFYLLCIYIYIHTRTCVKHCGGKLSSSHFRTLQWKHDSKCRHCLWCDASSTYYVYIYIHTRTCVKHCGGKLSISHFRTLQWKHDSKCRHCCGVMLLLLIMYIYIYYTQEPVWNIVGESCLSPTSERYSENMTQSVDTVVVWCFFYLLCIYIYIHTRTCVKHCGGKLSSPPLPNVTVKTWLKV